MVRSTNRPAESYRTTVGTTIRGSLAGRCYKSPRIEPRFPAAIDYGGDRRIVGGSIKIFHYILSLLYWRRCTRRRFAPRTTRPKHGAIDASVRGYCTDLRNKGFLHGCIAFPPYHRRSGDWNTRCYQFFAPQRASCPDSCQLTKGVTLADCQSFLGAATPSRAFAAARWQWRL